MNLHQEQLNIFKTVMEQGSFSAAARTLGKVPSAVSMAIQNLEIDLNLKLFDRVGREPIPTPQAHSLYQKTLELLQSMHDWQHHAYQLAEHLETKLTFAVVSELMHLPWSTHLSMLAQQFPSLSIEIMTTTQEHAIQILADQKANFAMMFEREQYTPTEQFLELTQESLVPIASVQHPLSRLNKIDNATLRDHRQIVIGQHHLTNTTSQTPQELVFSRDAWFTDNQHSALQLIQQHIGWGILPLSLLNQFPDWQKEFKILALTEFSPRFDYYVDLVWRKDQAYGMAAQFFLQQLRKMKN